MDKLYYFKNDSIVKESEFSYDKNTMNLYFVETYYTHLSFHCDTVKDTFYVNIDMNNDSSYTYQLCFKDGTILKYSNIDIIAPNTKNQDSQYKLYNDYLIYVNNNDDAKKLLFIPDQLIKMQHLRFNNIDSYDADVNIDDDKEISTDNLSFIRSFIKNAKVDGKCKIVFDISRYIQSGEYDTKDIKDEIDKLLSKGYNSEKYDIQILSK